MKTRLAVLIKASLFFLTVPFSTYAAESNPEPLSDPIPEIIQMGSITVAVEDFVRVSRSLDSSSAPQTNAAYARIQYMMPLPDNSGRLVINDLRGLLYLADQNGNAATQYLDIRREGVDFDDSMFPNETGLAGIAFHPQFAEKGQPGYGKFYTAYSAASDSGVANYLDDDADNHESIIREWTAGDPTANSFSGSSREIFRMGQFAQNHNIGTLAFNPAAEPGSSDYGKLYASFGDGGGANDPNEYGQATHEVMSSIIRIDPLAGGEDRAYGIPADNPFVGRQDFAPEIWAYGLRHPQHFSFDVDGTMYINDIGQTQIEEVNIGVPGANYGWRVREGMFATAFAFGIGEVRINPVYPKPEDLEEFTYPVAQFDHDEGNAISSGFVYRGNDIPRLQGKYVFTDMVRGRVFYIDTANLEAGNPATIQELRIQVSGEVSNLGESIGFPNTYGRGNRAGVRLGQDTDGELYFLSKGDGWIRKIVPAVN